MRAAHHRPNTTLLEPLVFGTLWTAVRSSIVSRGAILGRVSDKLDVYRLELGHAAADDGKIVF